MLELKMFFEERSTRRSPLPFIRCSLTSSFEVGLQALSADNKTPQTATADKEGYISPQYAVRVTWESANFDKDWITKTQELCLLQTCTSVICIHTFILMFGDVKQQFYPVTKLGWGELGFCPSRNWQLGIKVPKPQDKMEYQIKFCIKVNLFLKRFV